MPRRLPCWLPGLVALAAGGLQALALADPWTGQAHPWLQIGSLALLAGLLLLPGRRRRWPAARRGALLAWAFATAWLAGTFWWLYISMHTYGGLPAWLAALGVLGLAAFLGLYYAVAGGVAAALAAGTQGGYRNPLALALAFAAAWTLAELARGRWLTGFPWGAGGYAHVGGLLAGYAPWIGVYGIGLAAALLAAGAALLVTAAPQRGQAATLTVLLVVVAALPLGLLHQLLPEDPHPELRTEVALLQGNIPQGEKFDMSTGVADALLWYGEQLVETEAPLTVAPETAIPLLPRQLPPEYMAALQQRFEHSEQLALTGMPLGDSKTGYSNSVVRLVPPDSPQAYRYDKHHLVPFGEFIPPLFRWFTRMMNIPLGDFDRGALDQPSLSWQGQRLAPNICYEDLFGEELAARFRDAAQAPTVFVNLSNIAWFGDSVAIDQHLNISRMRALEFARPMLRATNTGATAIIDARGQVVERLPASTRGVLRGVVEGKTALTAYARWAARWGLGPLWLLALLMLACSAGLARHVTMHR